MMAFSGVRSSWLILARNSDLTRLDVSAVSCATRLSTSAFSSCIRSIAPSRNISSARANWPISSARSPNGMSPLKVPPENGSDRAGDRAQGPDHPPAHIDGAETGQRDAKHHQRDGDIEIAPREIELLRGIGCGQVKRGARNCHDAVPARIGQPDPVAAAKGRGRFSCLRNCELCYGGSRRASSPVEPLKITLAAELLTVTSYRPAGIDQRCRCVDQSERSRGSASTVTRVLAPGGRSTIAQPISRWPLLLPRPVT